MELFFRGRLSKNLAKGIYLSTPYCCPSVVREQCNLPKSGGKCAKQQGDQRDAQADRRVTPTARELRKASSALADVSLHNMDVG